MIGIAYSLVKLWNGELPWSQYKTEEDHVNKRKQIKADLSIEEICEGLPEEFAIFLIHCTNLKFEERPDYDYYMGIFSSLMLKNGYKLGEPTFKWDYVEEKYEMRKKKESYRKKMYKKSKESKYRMYKFLKELDGIHTSVQIVDGPQEENRDPN